MASPLLGLPGAVAADGIDEGVVAHYGNPFVEQRRLEDGRALAEVPRGIVAVAGPDRRSWLDSMTSQSLARLAPAESAETLFLDPNGHVEHAVRVVDDGETAWLVVEPAEAAPLAAFLDRMRFMLQVEVADRSAEFAVLAGADGPVWDAAPEAAAPHGTPLEWRDPWSDAPTPGGHPYASADGHPGQFWHWRERLVPVDSLGALAQDARAGRIELAGSLAVEAIRVAAWRPRFATEVDAKTIPHELDWLRSAVHVSKGCYKGQETVAKVLNLGRPPRRLVLLHLDGSDTVLPVAGDPVFADKTAADGSLDRREVGRITTAVQHHELGPVALAVVKRAVPGDLPFVVIAHDTEVAAAQQQIVPADAAPAVDVPRLPRLGARP
ncbi:YgfZ/GcvT domain-containing protein [Agromyces seonyuensis]|uniref:Folate-binding protein n=1 Tax=Agromyces seonyuensis TaxID=2662446 RepID=A0A6I4NTV8_9MICO|nr:folate-binding protein [Agromyces seonyuensis]MWB97710.1 folate-binding protein [Agromyces seonyuensis]